MTKRYNATAPRVAADRTVGENPPSGFSSARFAGMDG